MGKTKTKKIKPAEKKSVIEKLKALFTAARLKGFKEKLTKERDRLIKVMEEKRSKDLENAMSDATMQGDDADIANQTYEKEMIFEISSNERETIKQIEDALRKIENKTYGYCDACRKPIPVKRLMVLPQSRYCLPCQAIYESRR